MTRKLNLFIEGYGSRLRIKNGCLLVKRKGREEEEKHPFSEDRIGEICIDNGVSTSSNVLAKLAAHRIFTLILSEHDNPICALVNLEADRHVRTRLLQYEALKNGRGLEVAKQCLLAKMNGQNELLKKHGLHQIDCYRFSKAVEQLEGKDAEALRKKMMSYEGRCASLYWPEYFKLFPPSLRPEKRIKHRAYDGLNNVLNLAYKFLSWKARVALLRAGLDLSIGFLHTIRNGMFSLVYDFMESYRHLVDEFVAEYAKAENLSEKDFVLTTVDHAGTKDLGQYLERSRAADFKKRIYRYFETKASIQGITAQKEREIEMLMREDAMILAGYLRGQKKKWEPLMATL